MNTPDSNSRRSRLDEATSRRLAKLRTVPVDTSQLLKAVEAQIPRPPNQGPRLSGVRWFTPIRAAAASLLVIGLIVALVINSFSGPVLASADRLAQIHEEVSAGDGSHHTPVDSVDAAKATLAANWPGAPSVPQLPGARVMYCCIHMLGHKKTACVAVQADGVLVTIAVAKAVDVKLPASQVMTVDEVMYHVQSQGEINMVMTERDGRWVCLMGKLPMSRLVELAGSLRF